MHPNHKTDDSFKIGRKGTMIILDILSQAGDFEGTVKHTGRP